MSMKHTSALVAATALMATGMVATSSPANAKPAPDGSLNVMTLNLYLGSSLAGAQEASTKGSLAFLPEAAKAYDTAIKTNFPLRAQWIARTVKKQNPDVITLNELTDWVATSTSGVSLPNYDYLQIIQDALRNEGMSFEVASLSPNADLGFNDTIGIPYVNPKKPGCDKILPVADALRCQVRLKDRDAVLYNTASTDLQFTGTKDNGNFTTQETFVLEGSTLSFNRGWASAAFTWKGKAVTVLTAHLEEESQDGKGKKGKYGPKNWPSKVQVAQGKQLLKIAKDKARQTQGRVILGGDLNTDANGYYSPTYTNLTKSYFKDSWKQAGGKFGKAKGATCCQTGTLKSSKALDSGDPVIPTRIDLILTRKAKAVWKKIDGNKMVQNKQPKWESDHYFYSAAINLK